MSTFFNNLVATIKNWAENYTPEQVAEFLDAREEFSFQSALWLFSIFRGSIYRYLNDAEDAFLTALLNLI